MKQRGRVAARSDYLTRCITPMDTCKFQGRAQIGKHERWRGFTANLAPEHAPNGVLRENNSITG